MNRFRAFADILASEGGNLLILIMLIIVGIGAAAAGWIKDDKILMFPALQVLFKTMNGARQPVITQLPVTPVTPQATGGRPPVPDGPKTDN